MVQRAKSQTTGRSGKASYLMVTKLNLDDGTFLVPHELSENVDRYYEEQLLESAKHSDDFKNAKHKPFIDTVRFNAREFRAILVEGTEEQYREFVQREDREQKKAAYYSRCPISDGKGGIMQCQARIPNPDYGKIPGATKTIANRCDECPIFRAWKDTGKFTSLEEFTHDDDGEEKPHNLHSNGMLSRGELIARVRDILIRAAVEENSRYAELVRLILDKNLSINEACEKLDMNKSGVYKALRSDKMQNAVLERLDNDPFADLKNVLY